MGAFHAVTGLLFFSLSAQAVPSAQLQKLVDRTVDKNITYFHSVEKQSIRHCPQGRTFITGREPWTLAKRDIVLNEYEAPGSRRAVIIMPPTGGENVIDQSYANMLCSRGIRAVIVRSFELFPEDGVDLKMYDIEALRSLAAIRQTAEYLERTGTTSIGLLGTSLGAVQGAFGVMVDDRINTATLIVGGLGLARIAAASEEPAQAELRRIRMDMWNLNQDQYLEKLMRSIHVDAVPYSDDPTLAQRKKVLSIVAVGDTYVPTETQMRLYNVWGRQPLITMKRGHISTVMRSAFLHAMEIYSFFDQNLPR
jgi:hypothetical protein